jgi:putative transposase
VIVGEIELNIPRDRNSDFEPQIVKKGQKTILGIDNKITQIAS